MKKIVAILISLTFLSAFCTTAYAAEEDDPELYRIAYSLGADTDYLGVANYKHTDEHPLNNDCYVDFLHNCNLLEIGNRVNSFKEAIDGGSCLGISILEVLTHNGVISPSDIQEGVTNLSEIRYCTASDRYITDYQTTQMFTEFGNYERCFALSKTYTQKIDILMDTAEKCMKENKYFLIIIQDEMFSHAVCGIGITDGKWEYNDVSYDKCVLMLDSNIINEDGEPKGFSNNSCIYINSETKQSYIPAYDKSSDEIPSLSFITVDDDSLLNYRGMINRSEKLKTDTSRIKELSYKSSDNITITPIDKNGSNIPLPEDSLMGSWGTLYKVFEFDSVHIELQNEKKAQTINYNTIIRRFDISLQNEDKTLPYSCSIDCSENKLTVHNNGLSPIITNLMLKMNRDSFDFDPYYFWMINGTINNSLTVEVVEKGVLFKSDDMLDLSIAPMYYTLKDDGWYDSDDMSIYYPDMKYVYLKSNNDVLISIDESKKPNYYIDDNDDEVYDTLVQIGDINCDGRIDSSDASQVLSIYSKLSTSKHTLIGTDYYLADYNKDGHVNSIDASGILAEYSRLSTI